MQKDRYALITGGGGLLGIEHAFALFEIGYKIILIDKNQKKLITAKKKFYNKTKKHCLIIKCDISKEKEVLNCRNILKKKKIFVNTLVNNADHNPKMMSLKSFNNLQNYSVEMLQEQLSVGIIGTFNCIKIFGHEMAKKKRGIIINISSDLGINAPDQRVYSKDEKIQNVKNFKPIGYSISKHAIIGITKYIATYWAHKNIRCNTLVPGAVINNQDKNLVNNVKKRIPLNRWAKKNEYRKGLQFLASEDNSYMTGQSIIIDGGRSAW